MQIGSYPRTRHQDLINTLHIPEAQIDPTCYNLTLREATLWYRKYL